MSREYPCIYHENGRCKKFTETGYVDYCVLGPCSHETPSNADRIRAMSDEELAIMFDAFCEAAECRTADGAVCPFYSDCPSDLDVGLGKPWIVWLQQPAEEVQHE